MSQTPFTIERIYDAPVATVWKALTNNDDMRQWYFKLEDFRPEVGFEFSFYGGSKERQYLHLCRVTEVIPERKIAYSWRYEGYPGNSEVSFELFPEGDRTRLKLTHTGLESFPQDNKDFAPASFAAGWTSITGTSLKQYVENH